MVQAAAGAPVNRLTASRNAKGAPDISTFTKRVS
jgi:hypothetical protein